MKLALSLCLVFLGIALRADPPHFGPPEILVDDRGTPYARLKKSNDAPQENDKGASPVLIRFKKTGEVDTNFGKMGAVAVGKMVRAAAGERAIVAMIQLGAVSSAPGDGVLIAGECHYRPAEGALLRHAAFVIRLNALGVPDKTFGNHGVVLVDRAIDGIDDTVFAVRARQDGTVFLGIDHYDMDSETHALGVVKLKADGTSPQEHGEKASIRIGGKEKDPRVNTWTPDTMCLGENGQINVAGCLIPEKGKPFAIAAIAIPDKLEGYIEKFGNALELSSASTEWLGPSVANSTLIDGKEKKVWFKVASLRDDSKYGIIEYSFMNGRFEATARTTADFPVGSGTFFLVDGKLHMLRHRGNFSEILQIDIEGKKATPVTGQIVTKQGEGPHRQCLSDLNAIGLRALID